MELFFFGYGGSVVSGPFVLALSDGLFPDVQVGHADDILLLSATVLLHDSKN